MSFVEDEVQEKIILSDREQKKEITFDDGSSSVISSDILSCLDSQNYQSEEPPKPIEKPVVIKN